MKVVGFPVKQEGRIVAATGWPQNTGLENVETFERVFRTVYGSVNWPWVKDCQGALKVKNIPLSQSQASCYIIFFFFPKSTSAKVRTQAVILVGIVLHKTL